MDVRCGTCNKLFRVSDDKIIGMGIKFPCTRCGAYVRITHEDFEHYTLSHGTVSVLDLFESMPKPVAVPLPPEAAEPVARETAPPEHESQPLDLTAQAMHDDVLDEKAPSFTEPEHVSSAPAPKPESAAELKPEPFIQSKAKTVSPAEYESETKPEPLFVPQEKAKPTPERETLPEPDGQTPSDSPPPARPIQLVAPKREYAPSTAPLVSPVAERIAVGSIQSSTPSRSGKMFFVLIGTLIILGLAGYGVFVNLQPPVPQQVKKTVSEMITNEGLQIVNPVGSLEANGDLLLSGAIENATEKERTAWYVVLEIYDAQGAVLSKIRLLNGNQIYSQRDYDILAKRGANVQELKAKPRQGTGIIIPPKGRVNFEVRYFQPPRGIASFVAQALPFDPVQMQKEIAEDIK